jgi:hypothetical protein
MQALTKFKPPSLVKLCAATAVVVLNFALQKEREESEQKPTVFMECVN